MDCFVAEFIIGPAEGGTRWLLAMTGLKPTLLAMAVSPRSAERGEKMESRRLLAGGIEPGIDAALEAREGFQAMLVHERQ